MSRSTKAERRRRQNREAPSRPPAPVARPSPEPVVVEREAQRSRGAFFVSGALVLLVLGVVIARSSRAPDLAPSRPVRERAARVAPRASEGPAWPGEVEAHEVELLLPASYVSESECVLAQEPWVFRGRALDAVLSLARGAGVAPAQVERMRALARCDASGCVVTPDAALIESMGRESRSALYGELARHRENRLHALAAMRPQSLGPWTAMPHVSPRVRELVGRATWVYHGYFAFSDLSWLCTQLSPAERLEAVTTIYSRYTLDASVRVPASGDLEPMVRYWAPGAGEDEARRLLAGARGGSVPVASLLPAMARTRMGRYPAQGDPEHDCYWSSTRFFGAATPTESVPDVARADEYLQSAYREVEGDDRRLGDLYVFFGPAGNLVHMANLVAGDILFTKNGRSHTRPWTLMRLAHVRDIFPFTTLRVYRRR